MRLRLTFLTALAVALTSSASSAESDFLTVGSKAPALDIEHWISTGGGFDKVSQFDEGKVYVVEFWATWCGPCIRSMPHLAELQAEYAEKGVQFISVSDEDLDTVQEFLDGDVPEQLRGEDESEGAESDEDEAADPTFADLTSAWSLTTDPDESVSNDYMGAAYQNGIPTAFIVGRTGEIEWIGHPATIDPVIKQVVAGDWDREAFKKDFTPSQMLGKVQGDAMKAASAGDARKAGEILDAYEAEYGKSDELASLRLQLLMMAGDGEGFAKAALDRLESAESPIETIQTGMMLASGAQRLEVPAEMLTKAATLVGEAEVEGQASVVRSVAVGQLLAAAKDEAGAKEAYEAAIEAAGDNTQMKAQIRSMAGDLLEEDDESGDE